MIEVLTEEPVHHDGTGLARYTRTSRGADTNGNLTNGQKMLPELIRICSAPIRAILAGMLGTSASDFGDKQSFVLVRPFKILFHHSQDLKSLVKKLERKLSCAESFSTKKRLIQHTLDTRMIESRAPLVSTAGQHMDHVLSMNREAIPGGDSGSIYTPLKTSVAQSDNSEDDSSDNEGESREGAYKEEHAENPNRTELALKHFRVLTRFMDTEMETKQVQLLTMTCRKVFFADLWYLFRPGQEVIGRDGRQAYHVVSVTSPRHHKNQPWDTWPMLNSHKSKVKKKKKQSAFRITCNYIDFDGSHIGPVSEVFDFKHFDGQTEITSLPVYPIGLHVLKQSDVSDIEWTQLESLAPGGRFRQHLIKRGAKFLSILGIEPMYYAGPTLRAREEVESQVIIDFKTAFSTRNGKDKMTPPELQSLVEGMSSSEEEAEDGIVNQECTADCCRHDWVYDDTFVDGKERTRYVNSLLPSPHNANREPSIAAIPQCLKDLQNVTTATGYSISEDELIIMSCRVFGFVLRQRRWGECVSGTAGLPCLLTILD